MRKTKISYVPKSRIYPAFGSAYETPPRILIREDLPLCLRDFVLEHEKCHITDWQRLEKEGKEYNWIIGEMRAGFFGAIKHPFGFLLSVIMSFSPSRLKFYFKRFREGK